jgi:hypothetical protein
LKPRCDKPCSSTAKLPYLGPRQHWTVLRVMSAQKLSHHHSFLSAILSPLPAALLSYECTSWSPRRARSDNPRHFIDRYHWILFGRNHALPRSSPPTRTYTLLLVSRVLRHYKSFPWEAFLYTGADAFVPFAPSLLAND